MPRTLLLAAATAALAGIAALALFGGPGAARASGRLRQSVYVWQRAWDDDVRRAVTLHAHSFATTFVLGAEISWRPGAAPVTRIDVPWQSLRASRPIGVALRIGPCPRVPGADAADTALVTDAASALVADARSAGVEPAELQLDFDCAESHLGGYRAWLVAVRAAVAPVPLTITALPAWLGQSSFAPLVRATDGFVLQVHSIEPSAGPDDVKPLCDPELAIRWAERAAAAGVPFRVALPTYGYALGWSAKGRFLGVGAEGPSPGWPRDAAVRELSADASAIATLVRHWRRDRPAAMSGIVWFRLPVDGDTRNWNWTTLSRVMRGRAAEPRVRAAVSRPSAELADVRVENAGAADGVADAAIDVTWTGARLVGLDGSSGFTVEASPDGRARVRPPAGRAGRLAPGDARPVAWLRFDGAAEVEAHVVR